MTRPGFTLIVLLGGLLLGQGAAGLERPPGVGIPRAFALPAKEEFRLPNGMIVTLVPFGNVPKTTLLCVVGTGSVADGGKQGLADLVADLMKEGAGERDSATIARLAADMGGSLEVAAGAEQTTVSLDVLAERAPDAIALIGDVLRRPQLPAKELARLKANMTRQTAIARSQAQTQAGEAFGKLLWGDSVYGRGLPTDAQIGSITIEDIRRFASTEFSAARTHLYIAGRFDRAVIEASIRQAFDDWPSGAPRGFTTPSGSRHRVVQLIDRPGAAQSTIMLGLPVAGTSSAHFINLSVANALLGGSLMSRMNQNLREEKGYTYGVSTHLSPFVGIAGWTLSTDVNAPDTAAALSEILRELDRLRADAPPAEELTLTQNYRAGTFVLGTSSRSGLLGQLSFLDTQGLPEAWLTDYVKHVYAVTPADVHTAAQESLDPASMTLVIVGDLAKIKASLLALGALKGADFR
jgi:zinc protease